MPFTCSICEEASTRICGRCTKDTCSNHLCERCGWCSDCCACELRLDTPEEYTLTMNSHERSPEPHPLADRVPPPEEPAE